MKEKIYGVIMLLVVLFLILPSPIVSAKDNDYVMVDMKTVEEETINLDAKRYNENQDFVSEPSFSESSFFGLANKCRLLENFFRGKSGADTYSIIGTDDRWKITNTGQYPYTTIARITVMYQDGTSACGTGAMIGSRLLATAGHILINSDGSHPKSIQMQFGQNGSYVYHDTNSVGAYIYRTGYETNQPLEGDYGFIVFNDNQVSQLTGNMGVTTVPSLSDRLYTAGYPSDKGWYYMYASTGKIIEMEDDLLYHNMDTGGGQSGSPVYIIGPNGYPYLVAMHSSGVGTENIARRLNTGLFYWLRDRGYFD